ncbi:MAG: cytochrome P450 [Trebonia sp.]
MLRFATDDWNIGDITVRRRYPVLLVLASANRDQTVFPHPDTFDPSRNRSRAVTFGAGSHACPGFQLAHAEFTELFQRLVSGFRVVPEGHAGTIKGHVFRRHTSLPVRLESRRPAQRPCEQRMEMT